MMTLFDRAFLVTLDFRYDRRDAFLDRYKSVQSPLIPEIEIWPAIHGDTCQPPEGWKAGAGAWGCYRSHIGILEYCLNNRIGSYVVFEDDSQFKPYFADYLSNASNELPDYWQQLYLGGQLLHEHRHPPIQFSAHLYRPFNVNRTHCFAVNSSGMLPMYQHLCDLPFHGGEHIDHHLGRLHETFQYQVFCPGKWIVGQGGSSSNISGKTDPIHFWHDPESKATLHALNKDPICIVLRCSSAVRRELRTLHSGFHLDPAGFDRGLTEAAKYRNPTPEINRWYSFIRTEVIRSKGRYTFPCLWHPKITDDMLTDVIFRPVFIEASSVEQANEQLSTIESEIAV